MNKLIDILNAQPGIYGAQETDENTIMFLVTSRNGVVELATKLDGVAAISNLLTFTDRGKASFDKWIVTFDCESDPIDALTCNSLAETEIDETE